VLRDRLDAFAHAIAAFTAKPARRTLTV